MMTKRAMIPAFLASAAATRQAARAAYEPNFLGLAADEAHTLRPNTYSDKDQQNFKRRQMRSHPPPETFDEWNARMHLPPVNPAPLPPAADEPPLSPLQAYALGAIIGNSVNIIADFIGEDNKWVGGGDKSRKKKSRKKKSRKKKGTRRMRRKYGTIKH